MKRIKVIGIGSPFGQDQLGWQVVKQLQKTLIEPSNTQKQLSFIQSDRPGLRLLDLIKDTDLAILVDAIDKKECAGQIFKLERTELLYSDQPLSSHALGVSETLALGKALGDLPKELVLFGMCVDSHMQDPVRKEQLEQLCSQIRSYVIHSSKRNRFNCNTKRSTS